MRAPHEKDDAFVRRLIDAYEASRQNSVTAAGESVEPADGDEVASGELELRSRFDDVVAKLQSREGQSVTLPVSRRGSAAPVTLTLREGRRKPGHAPVYYIALPHQQSLRAEEWGKRRGNYGQSLSKYSEALNDWCQGKLSEIIDDQKPEAGAGVAYPLQARDGRHFRVDYEDGRLCLAMAPDHHGVPPVPVVLTVDDLCTLLTALHEAGRESFGLTEIRQVISRFVSEAAGEIAAIVAAYMEELGWLLRDADAEAWRLCEGACNGEALRDAILDYEQDA